MLLFHRLVAASLIALSGVSVLIASGMVSATGLAAPSLGAFIAGALFAPLFGHDGVPGLAIAGVGALGATLAGATIAGLILVLAGNEFLILIAAPVLVMAMIFGVPLALMVWLGTIALTHLVLWLLRPPP